MLSFFPSVFSGGGRREVFLILHLEAEFPPRFPTGFSVREGARAAEGSESRAQENDPMLPPL